MFAWSEISFSIDFVSLFFVFCVFFYLVWIKGDSSENKQQEEVVVQWYKDLVFILWKQTTKYLKMLFYSAVLKVL